MYNNQIHKYYLISPLLNFNVAYTTSITSLLLYFFVFKQYYCSIDTGIVIVF